MGISFNEIYPEKKTKSSQFMKRKEWKQQNPRDQLVAVLMGAAGLIDNAKDGLYEPDIVLPRKLEAVADLLEQAIALTKMVSGDWPEEE